MFKKKYVLVLALVLCLTTTLFVFTSIGYDPWVDQDEDGDIDATDLNVLAGDYGSTGDPTKNVSVTNWPEPQKPLFVETLVLRGTVYTLYKRYLMASPGGYISERIGVLADALYPPSEVTENLTYLADFLGTSWAQESELNFTYTPANSPYFIQGDVIIRPTLTYSFDEYDGDADAAYWNITVFLEKVGPEITTVLATETLSMSVDVPGFGHAYDTLKLIGVTFHFPWPVPVESGERLQIRLETWTRLKTGEMDDVGLWLLHEMGTDEFIAYIPIYQP